MPAKKVVAREPADPVREALTAVARLVPTTPRVGANASAVVCVTPELWQQMVAALDGGKAVIR